MYTLKQVSDCIKDAEITGIRDANFDNAKPIDQANACSIVWISSKHKQAQSLIDRTPAPIIVCDTILQLSAHQLLNKTFVRVADPRLAFLRIVNHFFVKKTEYGIHESVVIHPEAKVSAKAYIGPNSYIGDCFIDDDVIIHGNCFLYDGVRISKHVIIHAGTTIGSDGFGYQRNENKELEKFPHIGGVIIEEHVEIGANTCIDRGTLGDTIIKEGAKIDNLVHIAHNVVIGRHAAVIANSMIGGSTVIGDYSWIAPAASLRDGITIGKNVTVGIASNVTKNIPDNETWLGNPAIPLEAYLANRKK